MRITQKPDYKYLRDPGETLLGFSPMSPVDAHRTAALLNKKLGKQYYRIYSVVEDDWKKEGR